MKLTIVRLNRKDAQPTFGVFLREDGIPFALTLERPWRNNRTGESCIPLGNYLAIRHESPKFGNTFWLQDVPARTEIVFHKGNIEDDTHGCVLVGEQFEPLNGKDGILASAKGFEEFLNLTEGLDEIEVKITQGAG